MAQRDAPEHDGDPASGGRRPGLSPVEGSPEAAGRASGSIRGTWWGAIAVFVAVVVVLGSGTLAFTRFQRDVFNDTTTQFEQQMGALAELQQEILDAEIPIGGILYELSRSGELDDQWQQFERSGDRIEEDFLRLRSAVRASDVETLDRANGAWRSVVAGVAAARELWGTGEASAALARGEDPFGPTVWASLTETQQVLAALSLDSVAGLRVRAEQADHRQAAVEPLLVGALAVALAFSALSWRRLSTRVVRPLIALRAGATRMRDGDLTRFVRLDRTAGREVADLATSMNEMAVALNHSHGRLREHAYTDVLTGLANRRALTDLLEELSLLSDDPRALLLVDLDDFKYVNDAMGHAAGDELLRAVAGRLQSAARAGDTVARIGGDEFAVLVRAHDPLSTASVVAERILSSLQECFEINGTPVRVSCSIGIAGGPPQANSPDELVRNADVAMYMAKSCGKQRVDLFDPAMHAAMVSRAELRTDLARAVEQDQLELHYQPVIDLHSGEIVGFEALVRWQHPTRGLLPPLEFIAMAEETGDIHAIGGWVIDRACRDLASYQAAGGVDDRDPWMAVNVSGSQILTGDLIETVTAALSRHGIRPDALILEVTEATLVDTTHAATVLAQLRSDGVRVAIDDFGTGFSSLRYLHELPIDCIKIDRSFVAESSRNPQRSLILETIVTMGHGLGLQLIAEGIEQISEFDHLARLGPMAGQGYLIARPMPAAQAIRLLQGDRQLPSARRSRHCSYRTNPPRVDVTLNQRVP